MAEQVKPKAVALDVVNLSQVKTKPIEWFWRGYIAKGRLTLVVGDPGVGKSWFTLALATHKALGVPLPGVDAEEFHQGAVLLVGAEDPLEDTVRPRLEALGAQLTQIEALRSSVVVAEDGTRKEAPFSLAEDMGLLAQVVEERRYSLIVIDPINAYLGSDVDAHRDTEIRSILAPLARLAERCGVAIVAVMHLNKAVGGKAIYRVLGSIGYAGAARSILLVGQDSEEETETTVRHVVQVKNNLGRLQPAQSFDLARGALAWVGESGVTASALLGHVDDETREATRELRDTIQGALALEGGFSGRQLAAWARQLGLSERAGRRACQRLGVKSWRSGTGDTRWSIPPDSSGHFSECP